MDYLIPANTKKGQLILGIFRPVDLILFGTGILITLILLLIVPLEDALVTVFVLMPALGTGFLVLPIPNYHNMLTVIVEAWAFFFQNQQRYVWKGWCVKDVKDVQR